MSELIGARAPGWVRIVAALGIVWNLIGVYMYLVSVGVLSGAADPAMAVMPSWVTAAFATSVFAGVLGSIGLVMLKGWSRLLLALSLLAVLAQDFWLFGMSGAPIDGNTLMMPAIVTVISAVLFWVAHDGVKKGWLN